MRFHHILCHHIPISARRCPSVAGPSPAPSGSRSNHLDRIDFIRDGPITLCSYNVRWHVFRIHVTPREVGAANPEGLGASDDAGKFSHVPRFSILHDMDLVWRRTRILEALIWVAFVVIEHD